MLLKYCLDLPTKQAYQPKSSVPKAPVPKLCPKSPGPKAAAQMLRLQSTGPKGQAQISVKNQPENSLMF